VLPLINILLEARAPEFSGAAIIAIGLPLSRRATAVRRRDALRAFEGERYFRNSSTLRTMT
jgi:hypothetical protein